MKEPSQLPKKILLALHAQDDSAILAKGLSAYEVETASDGPTCLQKIASFSPSIIFLDLMLPKMHGIEVMREVRKKSYSIGIVLVSDMPMLQAYDAAKKLGVDEFIIRPINVDSIVTTAEKYWRGELSLSAFAGKNLDLESKHCYIPKIHHPDHYLKFWGTRGSSAVAGADYIRYGGSSSCLEVHADDELIIIDAGTGIRPLGERLVSARVKKIHLILGHTHWDHITGFPFFGPIYEPSVHLSIWAPIGFGIDTKELFMKMLGPAFFPVRIEDIKARIEFHPLRDQDTIKLHNVTITTHYAYHPGPTLCFKIQKGEKTIGYVTDNEFLYGYHGHPAMIDAKNPLLRPYQSQIAFFKDVDLMILEAQYTPFEYQERVGWGHSSISNAAVLIKHTQTKEWIVTHHDPKHTDTLLTKKLQLHRDILEDCQIDCKVMMAHDGLSLPF